jgi:hypothetical protein
MRFQTLARGGAGPNDSATGHPAGAPGGA